MTQDSTMAALDIFSELMLKMMPEKQGMRADAKGRPGRRVSYVCLASAVSGIMSVRLPWHQRAILIDKTFCA